MYWSLYLVVYKFFDFGGKLCSSKKLRFILAQEQNLILQRVGSLAPMDRASHGLHVYTTTPSPETSYYSSQSGD